MCVPCLFKDSFLLCWFYCVSALNTQRQKVTFYENLRIPNKFKQAMGSIILGCDVALHFRTMETSTAPLGNPKNQNNLDNIYNFKQNISYLTKTYERV